MPENERPRDADLDDVNQRLNEGLESCRSMVASYKELLAPQVELKGASNDRGLPEGGLIPEEDPTG